MTRQGAWAMPPLRERRPAPEPTPPKQYQIRYPGRSSWMRANAQQVAQAPYLAGVELREEPS